MSTESPTLRQQFIDAVRTASDFESVAALYSRVVHQGLHVLTQCPYHDCLLYTSDAADE